MLIHIKHGSSWVIVDVDKVFKMGDKIKLDINMLEKQSPTNVYLLAGNNYKLKPNGTYNHNGDYIHSYDAVLA